VAKDLKDVKKMVKRFMDNYGTDLEGALIIVSQITGLKLEVLKKEIKDESDLGV
jgi:hypothetical protein